VLQLLHAAWILSAFEQQPAIFSLLRSNLEARLGTLARLPKGQDGLFHWTDEECHSDRQMSLVIRLKPHADGLGLTLMADFSTLSIP
jgi:hypothetical protein